MMSETVFDNLFSKLKQEWQIRNRSVIGNVISILIVFFKRGTTEESLDYLGENTTAQRQVSNVGYGKEKR